MKNLKIATLLIFGLLAACQRPELPRDKDTGGESGPSPYVGEWTYSSIALSNGVLKLGEQNFGSFEGEGKDIVGKVVISENPNVYSTDIAFTAAIQMTVFGQTVPSEVPVEKRTSTGTWKEVNGKLELYDDNGNTVNVLSSSGSRIQFSGNFAEEVSIPAGFSLQATSDVVFTLVK